MVRPKTFDMDEILDKAVEVFWSRGYEGTSLTVLEEQLGIGRQSLYNAFGDKHTLFLKALERYDRHSADWLTRQFGPGAGLDELRGWFRGLVEFLTPEGPRRACLIANSLLEKGGCDGEVRDACGGSTRRMLAVFSRVLATAAARGEIEANADVDGLSRLLLAQTHGLSVLAKAGLSKSDLEAANEALFVRFAPR